MDSSLTQDQLKSIFQIQLDKEAKHGALVVMHQFESDAFTVISKLKQPIIIGDDPLPSSPLIFWRRRPKKPEFADEGYASKQIRPYSLSVANKVQRCFASVFPDQPPGTYIVQPGNQQITVNPALVELMKIDQTYVADVLNLLRNLPFEAQKRAIQKLHYYVQDLILRENPMRTIKNAAESGYSIFGRVPQMSAKARLESQIERLSEDEREELIYVVQGFINSKRRSLKKP